jgi:hypothetical protein
MTSLDQQLRLLRRALIEDDFHRAFNDSTGVWALLAANSVWASNHKLLAGVEATWWAPAISSPMQRLARWPIALLAFRSPVRDTGAGVNDSGPDLDYYDEPAAPKIL